MRRASDCLRYVACCAALAAASALPRPVVHDAPLPPVVRVCVVIYPPFILERSWYGKSFNAITYNANFKDPASLSGIAYRGHNVSLLDGYDIGFTQLLFSEYLGAAVEYRPYPDYSSLYVGLRNDECDVAASAVELDARRAMCGATCPDTSQALLPELPGADYVQEAYRDRLDEICCLDYGVPHMPANGFALLSKPKPSDISLVSAIISVDVLNAATPIIIAIIGFGWLMYAVEGRDNKEQFRSQHAGVYYAFVGIATFGFGDLAPVTRTGRLLTVFWCILSVMSVSALTSVVSARLTIDQLAYSTIDSLSQMSPSQLCVEAGYPAVESLVSDTFALGGDLEAAGVMLGTVQTCSEAVLAADADGMVYLSDQPLLSWLAFQYFDTGNLHVSPTIRANPLTLAYPSGSQLRKLADVAVITMLSNTTWIAARERLEHAWFAMGSVVPPNKTARVNIPTLVAAGVLVLVWLAGMVVSLCRKTVARVSQGDGAMSRVASKLRGRRRSQRGSDAAGGKGGGGDAAGATAEEGTPRADCGKAASSTPRSSRLIETMDI